MTRRRPQQWFYFGPWMFSVAEAEALIADMPRKPDCLDVAAWASAYGLTHIDDPHPHAISLIGPTSDGLDRAYALRTDLTKPILVATLQVDGEPTPLLIDGVHRLYHAWHEGISRLAAYVLTATETQQITHIRIIGGTLSPHRHTTPSGEHRAQPDNDPHHSGRWPRTLRPSAFSMSANRKDVATNLCSRADAPA